MNKIKNGMRGTSGTTIQGFVEEKNDYDDLPS